MSSGQAMGSLVAPRHTTQDGGLHERSMGGSARRIVGLCTTRKGPRTGQSAQGARGCQMRSRLTPTYTRLRQNIFLCQSDELKWQIDDSCRRRYKWHCHYLDLSLTALRLSPSNHGPIGFSHRRARLFWTVEVPRVHRLALSLVISSHCCFGPGPGTRRHDKSLRIFLPTTQLRKGSVCHGRSMNRANLVPGKTLTGVCSASIRQSCSARVFHQDNRRHCATSPTLFAGRPSDKTCFRARRPTVGSDCLLGLQAAPFFRQPAIVEAAWPLEVARFSKASPYSSVSPGRLEWTLKQRPQIISPCSCRWTELSP